MDDTSDSKRRKIVLSIFAVGLTVAAFASLGYLIFNFLSDDSTQIPQAKFPLLPTEGRTEHERLLYGNDSTILCGTQLLGYDQSTDVRVVGGKQAVHGEFPWHVVLLHRSLSGGKQDRQVVNLDPIIVCGGSLIGNRWIITAAHCVDPNIAPEPIVKERFVLGLYNVSSSNYFSVSSDLVIRHPNWTISPLPLNDIALIKTAKKIDLTGEKYPIVPICLPERDVEPSGIATVSGFGRLNETYIQPDLLQTANIPIVDNAKCGKQHSVVIPKNIMCAGHPQGGIDVCSGDSGGIAVLFDTNKRATGVGIASAGIGCARPNSPALYTRVSNYVDWIYSTIEANS